MLKETWKEWKLGKCDGPWKVFQGPNGELCSEVPYQRWLPTVRFPVVQDKSNSSYDVRPIDNCQKSGLSTATAVQEKMRMSSLQALLKVAKWCNMIFGRWGKPGEPRVSKGDHKKAFRTWATAPEDAHLLITWVWDALVGEGGGFLAFGHRALPFGSLASVWAYTWVSQAVCLILGRLFACPQLAYMDDFLRVVPMVFAPLMQFVFKKVHELIGIPLKDDKGEGPAQILEALGHALATTALWAGLRLTCRRRAKLKEEIEIILRAAEQGLTQKKSGELGGQLTFAASALYGRVGRAFAAVLARHRGGWTAELQWALEWWRALLELPLYSWVRHGKAKVRAVAWVDGSWEMLLATGAVGGLLFISNRGPVAFSAVVPKWLCDELASVGKMQRNTQVELLAIVVLLLSCGEMLHDVDLIVYEDNQAAMANVLTGAAGEDQSRHLVASIWMLTAAVRARLWLEYVRTDLNPGDCFSRPEEQEKLELMEAIVQYYNVTMLEAVFPPSMFLGAQSWADSIGRHVSGDFPRGRKQAAEVAASL